MRALQVPDIWGHAVSDRGRVSCTTIGDCCCSECTDIYTIKEKWTEIWDRESKFVLTRLRTPAWYSVRSSRVIWWVPTFKRASLLSWLSTWVGGQCFFEQRGWVYTFWGLNPASFLAPTTIFLSIVVSSYYTLPYPMLINGRCRIRTEVQS